MTTPLKLPVPPLDRAGRLTVSLGAEPAAVTRVKGTPSLVSAACQAAVVGSADPSPISRIRRFTAGGPAADAVAAGPAAVVSPAAASAAASQALSPAGNPRRNAVTKIPVRQQKRFCGH